MKTTFLFALFAGLTLFTSCKKKPTAEFSLSKYEYQAGDAIEFNNISKNFHSSIWEIINDNGVTIDSIEGNYPNIITPILAKDNVYTLRLTAFSKREKKSSTTEKTFLIKSQRNYLNINTSGGGNHDDYKVYVDNQFIGEAGYSGAFQAKIPIGLRIVKLVAPSDSITTMRDFNSNVNLSF